MSFSATALQLINRVNRRRRVPDVSSIADTEEYATLDSVNRMIGQVLSARRWEFDIRHGQIVTRARETGVSLTVTEDASTGLLQRSSPALANANVFGDFVARVLPKGAATLSDTSLRIVSSSSVIATFSTATFQAAIPDALSTTTAEILYTDYLLPEVASNVITVTHQEDTLSLEEVGAKSEFNYRYPRMHIEYGQPRVVSVGGLEVSTYQTGQTAPEPRLRMRVWPVPDDDYVLDYTYDYRHPTLDTATDTLDGVPPDVVDLIVELAAEDMIATFDRRVDDAEKMRRSTVAMLGEIHERHSGMYAERASVGNWDGVGARDGRRSITQGRLIGGN